jgi:hypothetical protein
VAEADQFPGPRFADRSDHQPHSRRSARFGSSGTRGGGGVPAERTPKARSDR